MKLSRGRVPITWSMLWHRKGRLLLAVFGVAFAVLLMFMQLGFLTGLFDSQTLLIRAMDADIVLVSTTKYNLDVEERMPRLRLEQALDVEGVTSVTGIRLDNGFWRGPTDPAQHVIRIIGLETDDAGIITRGLAELGAKLREKDTALFDARSREFFGMPAVGSEVEINGRAVKIGGYVELGADFRNDGTVFVSFETFEHLFPTENASQASAGLVRIRPGADVEQIARDLRESLPKDVLVHSKRDFERIERNFWAQMTPTGYIFTLGLAVGFVIGVMICYQILYNEINDHLPQFATMKAIGFTNGYLVGLVLREAMLLAVLGLVPALLASQLFYSTMIRFSGLYMELTPVRILLVSTLTFLMCIVSALLAITRVLRADPAEVFA